MQKICNYLSKAKSVKITDGNGTASRVCYGMSDQVFMYPITPSTPIVEKSSEYSAQGVENMFGNVTDVAQLQSELGVSASVHGSCLEGVLTSTASTSQGLLLMYPTLLKIVGEGLPSVFHVPCRQVGSSFQSLNADHSDVMSMRLSGIGMLNSTCVQEVHDMGVISHLVALEGQLPFIHFFDGFRTSHEFAKIEELDYNDIMDLVDKDALARFRKETLDPKDPYGIGGGFLFRNINFLTQEAHNEVINAIPDIVDNVMDRFYEKTNRRYNVFDFYGHEDAEDVVVIMASGAQTAIEVAEYLSEKYGDKVGVVVPRLFQPFSAKHFIESLPKNVKNISVMDRVKERGSTGDPLYHEVITSLLEHGMIQDVNVLSGRFGIAGHEFTAYHVESIFDNMKKGEPKNHFTVGIQDDIFDSSLSLSKENTRIDMDEINEGVHQCMFWGLGGDGTIVANQQAVDILGTKTDLHPQVYFDFDGKKTGGMTCTHMRLSSRDNDKKPIRSEYFIQEADYLACHVVGYVETHNVPKYAKQNGTFVLNCPWSTFEELDHYLPREWKEEIALKNLDFYVIDAQKIASSVGLGGRINMIMQTVFFSLSNILPIDEAINLLKEAIVEEFSKKGDKIVSMNMLGVDHSLEHLIKIDVDKEKWLNIPEGEGIDLDMSKRHYLPRKNSTKEEIERMERTLHVIQSNHAMETGVLKMSELEDFKFGKFPMDTKKYEKRGIAVEYPSWDAEKCIGCNMCAYVCPHSVIRPFLLTEEEVEELHQFDSEEVSFSVRDEPVSKKKQEFKFRIQVSPLDCLGCSCCVTSCPVGALEMRSSHKHLARESENAYWDYLQDKTMNDEEFWRRGYNEEKYKKFTIQGSQFRYPYLQFPDSCAGCAETAYMRLLTQLYGQRMVVSNATGCSMVSMGIGPAYSMHKDLNGEGPAYATSLFEDAAEFGFGMFKGTNNRRNQVKWRVEKYLANEEVSGKWNEEEEFRGLLNDWMDTFGRGEENEVVCEKIFELLKTIPEELLEEGSTFRFFKDNEVWFLKTANWLVGGDGFSFDIDFGGLIHVIQQNEDFNVFIFDNQIYSNTGGQQSKASPIGGIAKLAPAGKKTVEMDLGKVIMGLENVYVASVAMGADPKQLIKAIKEAEEYEGSSVIIAYCPCIGHGPVKGLGKETLSSQDLSVSSGFWPLFRFHPENGFTLDSKKIEPEKIEEFFEKELRFNRMRISEEKQLLLNELKDYVKRKANFYELFKNISNQEQQEEN